MRVDLPEPLGPRRPSFEPGDRVKFTFWKSWRSPSVFETFFTWINFLVWRPVAAKSILAEP